MLMMKIRDVVIGFVVSAIVVGIAVSCGGGGGSSGPTGPATYTVSGALTGATGAIVLKLNGGADISMANGSFTFSTMLADQAFYNVQVVDANDRCTVTGGAGQITAANVTGVVVNCVAPASEKVVRSAQLSGAQENPAVVTSATAPGGIVFDPATSGITGGITVSGLTPTSVGVFQAPAGNPTGNSAIPAIITLSAAADGKTYFIPAGTTLTAGQITALRAGELYFNVITAAQSAGEIRGQINLQGGVLAGVANMDFAQEVSPPGTCTGITTSGQGTVIVDRATRMIKVSYMTHDVTTANLAHIHTSPTGPGSNGGVIINFTPAAGGVPNPAYQTVAESQMTPTNISDFLLGYLYFNIHSATDGCPGGEIRGNITPLQ
jgi:CHRD domain-containing protein